jgi:hypothetical protein
MLFLVAGCGGGGTAAVPSAIGDAAAPNGDTVAIASRKVRHPSPSPGPSSTPAPTGSSTPSPTSAVTPLPASAFNDSVGVNTHINYYGSAYDTGYATWSPTLLNSRIKHVRDQFCNWGTASTFCTQTWAQRWNQFAAAGIHFDVISNPWMGWSSSSTGGCHGTCFLGYPAALGLTSSGIEAYEGPNECDESSNCTSYGTTTQTQTFTVDTWTPLLWTLRSATTAIYSPAMAFPNDYSQFGNLSQYINVGAIHDYTKPLQPEYSNGTSLGIAAWQSGTAPMTGTAPLITTENGYNTDPTFANGGVSQLAQERYTPRILLTHLEHNIRRVYLYELIDLGTSGSGNMWGLLNANYTPKPAWTRLTQLMNYFADSGTASLAPLSYSLSGDTTGVLNKVLFEKSDGSYILVPWLGTQLWNPSSDSDLAPSTETLTLQLPSTVTSVTVTKFADNGATTTTTLSGTSGRFSLPVSSLIEGVAFHP